MSSIEPEPTADDQEAFFQHIERECCLFRELKTAEEARCRPGPSVLAAWDRADMLHDALKRERKAERRFLLARGGVGFRIFRPEWLAEALIDVPPLFPQGGGYGNAHEG